MLPAKAAIAIMSSPFADSVELLLVNQSRTLHTFDRIPPLAIDGVLLRLLEYLNKLRRHCLYSAYPLLSTTTSRPITRERNAAWPGPIRQISVRMVSPGKTGEENLTSMRVSRLGS